MSIWYAHYPGDYGRDTAHLSLAMHGAYRLLLDHYFSTAKPLPTDPSALYRICRAFDEAEKGAVDSVVHQFFVLQNDGYHNRRADRELAIQAERRERSLALARELPLNDGEAIAQLLAQQIAQRLARR